MGTTTAPPVRTGSTEPSLSMVLTSVVTTSPGLKNLSTSQDLSSRRETTRSLSSRTTLAPTSSPSLTSQTTAYLVASQSSTFTMSSSWWKLKKNVNECRLVFIL